MTVFSETDRREVPAVGATARIGDSPASAQLPVRMAARAIDILVVTALALSLGSLMGFGALWVVVGAVAVLAYFASCDRFFGATLGKLAFGLRVVGPGGGRPSLRQALIRESCMIVGAIPFIGPLLAFAAWIWIGVSIRSNPLGQGKHDLLAGGTRVLRTRVP